MAWKDMQLASTGKGERDTFAWEFEEILNSPGDGDWIMVPNDVGAIAVTLSPTAGSGKIQTTTDKIDVVKNGSPVAIDWDDGVVAISTHDVFFPITAFRMVNVTGTTKITVRAQ